MQNKVNCILVDDEPMALDILNSHLSNLDHIKVVGSCSNATEAFNLLNKEKIDLIFLDINMPGISGISFAKSINSDIKIIFTTAYREFAIEGFNLHAVDYLLKPISLERLMDSVNNFFKVHSPTHLPKRENEEIPADFIFVKENRKMVKLIFDKVLYIESLSDYLKIHLNTKEVLVTRETITNIQEKLPKNQFLRIHRSFIINLNKIDSYSNEEIIIQQKSLPISRSYKEDVIGFLNSFQ